MEQLKDEFSEIPVTCPKCGRLATSVNKTGNKIFYNHGDAKTDFKVGEMHVSWNSCEVDRPIMTESGFDQEIVNYICKRLREGVEDSAIRKELMDTSNPNFIKISGDLGVAISYIEYAKKVCPKAK